MSGRFFPKANVVAKMDSGIVSTAVNETGYGPSVSGLSVTVIAADSVPIAVGA